MARAAETRADLPEDLRGPLKGEGDETVNIASFPYGCHVCEVEVDPETGRTEIVRYSAVDDCGRAINPLIVHGQIHGGIVQGVGQALWEQIVYDRHTAQLLTGSFMDYAMPRADLLPFFNTELSEVPCPTHPLGMRPAGEGGTTPALGRRHQRDRRCARRVRRHACRDAGDAGTGVAGDPRQDRLTIDLIRCRT